MPTDRAGHRDDGRPSDRSSGRDQSARDHIGDPGGGERSAEHVGHRTLRAKSPDRSHRPAVTLDDLDKAIIAELQRDGRIAYADLAPLVGLSPAATRQRVQRLLDAKVVNVLGVTDPLALGFPVMAMLGVQVDGDVVTIADRVAEIDGVIYVVLSSGSFDLLVEVIAEDTGSLLGVINDRLKAIDGVRRVESFLYFGIHTHRFGWGAR
jgi:Lrp/AsnC family transcriptional regulator for asnA, asnC and gidA